jgi:hypothetical protein
MSGFVATALDAVDNPVVVHCKYCKQDGHVPSSCPHLTVDHDSEGCTVCQARGRRRQRNSPKTLPKEHSWQQIDWDSVLASAAEGPIHNERYKVSAARMFMRSALVRKNLLLQCFSGNAHSPVSFVVRTFAGLQKRLNTIKNNPTKSLPGPTDGSAWVLKPPASSNAHGVVCFKDSEAVKPCFGGGGGAFVIQEYVEPLLLRSCKRRKFHVRALVLCVGDLDVYLYRNARVLCATTPWTNDDFANRFKHITNLSVNESCKDYALEEQNLDLGDLLDDEGCCMYHGIFEQMETACRLLFTSLASNAKRNQFFPLKNTYEMFGLDFAVNSEGQALLLEANPEPSMTLFPESRGDREVLVRGNPLYEDDGGWPQQKEQGYVKVYEKPAREDKEGAV